MDIRLLPLLFLVLLAACERNHATIVHRSAPYMGTTVEITVVAGSTDEGERAISEGFSEVARMELMFSSYRQDSDLARVNAAAGHGPVPVPRPFVELLEKAKKVAEVSDGAFNPLVGPAVKLWGIPEAPQVPSREELERLLPLTALGGLSVSAADGTVALSRPGMALGLGGIAKGYTAERVAARLRERGIGAGIVAVAGDIRTFGTRPDGQPWRIGVRRPRAGAEPAAVLEMGDGAVSTSGDYERYFELGGVRYHHILDPRTLWPARSGTAGVTVLAPDAATADGLATALFVMGPQAGLQLVQRLPGVEALYIAEDGTQSASAGWPGGGS